MEKFYKPKKKTTEKRKKSANTEKKSTRKRKTSEERKSSNKKSSSKKSSGKKSSGKKLQRSSAKKSPSQMLDKGPNKFYMREQLFDTKGKRINNKFEVVKGKQPNHTAYEFAKKKSYQDHVSLLKMARVIVVYYPAKDHLIAYFIYLIKKGPNADLPRNHLQPIIKKIKQTTAHSLKDAEKVVFPKKP